MGRSRTTKSERAGLPDAGREFSNAPADGPHGHAPFRHTYASARLQTLDDGHPTAERTAAGEMGHGGFEMVRKVYGHLGTIRHRAEVVEYRLDQHRDVIPRERPRLLRAVA